MPSSSPDLFVSSPSSSLQHVTGQMPTPSFIVSVPSNGTTASARRRSQVARACNWCRVHRLKCDSDFPCANCRKRGGDCNNDRLNRAATLPEATREIERLKKRVEELELEVQKERKALPVSQVYTPHTPNDSLDSAVDLADSRSHKSWDGIFISTPRSPNKTWYGASSLFFFIGSINNYLTNALKQTDSPRGVLTDSANTLGPTESVDECQGGRHTPGDTRGGESLSSMQEEFFLNLFWDSFNPTYPILHERDFKEHYQSLWVDSDTERKPSALVDIVLALCMQYGMARQPGKHALTASQGDSNEGESIIAGRWHYRRCLTLLSDELESPTLSTLQCHLLCSIYLCCAGFQNMSDNACALAIRTAFMLGLHIEPPQNMPRRERELRKRTWWTLFVLDSNRSMKLGRPFTLQEYSSSCTLPADDREIASLSGSSFAPIGGHVTWLTWNLHKTKLVLAARKAYMALYSQPPDIIFDPEPIAKTMATWLQEVPEPLKTGRRSGGIPFSTDRTPLESAKFTPEWLQRERILLELLYHNLCMSLYRLSITSTLNGVPSAGTEQAALKCAAHAMALTGVMHQVLDTSSMLNGWHEAFQWQWNAAMTLVGFVLAFPNSVSASDAREAIDLSVSALEHFGGGFAITSNAATIMRDLGITIDSLQRDWDGGDAAQVSPEALEVDALGNNGLGFPQDAAAYDQAFGWPMNLDDGTAEIGGILGHSIDISAEALTDFDWSTFNNSFFDQWAV